MNKSHRVIAAVAVSGGVVLGSGALVSSPAEAAAGRTVKAHVQSPGKASGNGATTLGSISKTGASTLLIRSAYVNDTCGPNGSGDGYRAKGRVQVKYSDGTSGYGSWHQDAGGCAGTPRKSDWGTFRGSKRIVKAGFQACVFNGPSKVVKCASAFTSY